MADYYSFLPPSEVKRLHGLDAVEYGGCQNCCLNPHNMTYTKIECNEVDCVSSAVSFVIPTTDLPTPQDQRRRSKPRDTERATAEIDGREEP